MWLASLIPQIKIYRPLVSCRLHSDRPEKEAEMENEKQETMGEIIAQLFEDYLEHYQDKNLASVAAAATINEILASLDDPPKTDEDIQAA